MGLKTHLTIFLDMDGVISDLTSGIIEFTGDTNIGGNRGKLFDEYLPHYVEAQGFFTQPVMRNADILVDNLIRMNNKGWINLSILTSVGKFYSPSSKILHQKKMWLEKNFPELTQIPFCTVSGGREKARLAHPNAALIDDHQPNVAAFTKDGACGYHYESPNHCVGAIQFVENLVINY